MHELGFQLRSRSMVLFGISRNACLVVLELLFDTGDLLPEFKLERVRSIREVSCLSQRLACLAEIPCVHIRSCCRNVFVKMFPLGKNRFDPLCVRILLFRRCHEFPPCFLSFLTLMSSCQVRRSQIQRLCNELELLHFRTAAALSGKIFYRIP